jgi:hypothetical protein
VFLGSSFFPHRLRSDGSLASVGIGRDRDTGLAALALISLTSALGDDDALFADGCLTPVALHQCLAVGLALFADGSTAVLLAATVADDVRAANGVGHSKL